LRSLRYASDSPGKRMSWSIDRGAESTPPDATAGADDGVMPPVVADDAAAGNEEATEPRAGLVDDVIDELRWTFSGRKGWLLGMAFNLAVALVVVGYQDYDPHKPGDIKIAGVGVAVVAYVLASTLATNQLGADADRVINSVERGDRVPRILALKNVALAVLLIPVALLVSLIVRLLVERWRLMPVTAAYDVGAVVLWLGIGNVLSVMLPYRPISLRARLKARKSWKRWALRQAMPYALYYLGQPVLIFPAGLAHKFEVFGKPRFLDYPDLLYYPLITLGNALVVWLLGLWLATAWTNRHRQRFEAELRRPD
jgi:hypothetical protein